MVPNESESTLRLYHGDDPELERFRAFDAVSRLLGFLFGGTLMMLMIDDLNTADPDPPQLSRFVARGIRETRVLVVGTYRETETRRGQRLAPLIAELAREGASSSRRTQSV